SGGGAAIYPMALVAARIEPTGRERVATALGPKTEAPAIPQRALATGGPWLLGPGAGAGATRIARHLRTVCPTLGDRWTPQLGVKTGADDVFLVAHPGPVTRPIVRGRDLGPWRATPRAHMLWTHGPDGRPLARLSAELASVVRRLPLPPASPAAWQALADQGRANASDDDAIADMYQLEAADRRALDASAADPF